MLHLFVLDMQLLTKWYNIVMIADYVVIGSDSGRIVILEYIPSKNTFERVNESFLLLTEQYLKIADWQWKA